MTDIQKAIQVAQDHLALPSTELPGVTDLTVDVCDQWPHEAWAQLRQLANGQPEPMELRLTSSLGPPTCIGIKWANDAWELEVDIVAE